MSFLSLLDRVVERLGNGYRLCLVEDLYEWVGDRLRVGISGEFRAPGENDNGRRVIDFCARNQDGVEMVSMIYLVLVLKDMMRNVRI